MRRLMRSDAGSQARRRRAKADRLGRTWHFSRKPEISTGQITPRCTLPYPTRHRNTAMTVRPARRLLAGDAARTSRLRYVLSGVNLQLCAAWLLLAFLSYTYTNL